MVVAGGAGLVLDQRDVSLPTCGPDHAAGNWLYSCIAQASQANQSGFTIIPRRSCRIAIHEFSLCFGQESFDYEAVPSEDVLVHVSQKTSVTVVASIVCPLFGAGTG